MRDFLGNELFVGDVIVYPNRQGSSLWMNVAVITKIDRRDEKPTLHITVFKQDTWSYSTWDYYPCREEPITEDTTFHATKTTITRLNHVTKIDLVSLPSNIGRRVIEVLEVMRTESQI